MPFSAGSAAVIISFCFVWLSKNLHKTFIRRQSFTVRLKSSKEYLLPECLLMKSTRTLVMTVALSVGLVHASPAFAWHLETTLGGYMMLAYLNLVIIVFLGLCVSIAPRNRRPLRPRGKHLQGKLDLNKIHDQPAAQGYATRVGQMIDATFVEVPRLRNSREKDAQIKTGMMPITWQEKSAQPKFHQKDVDACWIKKRRESHSTAVPSAKTIMHRV
jgi:hypothetical protein